MIAGMNIPLLSQLRFRLFLGALVLLSFVLLFWQQYTRSEALPWKHNVPHDIPKSEEGSKPSIIQVPPIPSIPAAPSIPAIPSVSATPSIPSIPSILSIASTSSSFAEETSIQPHSTLEVPSQLLESISQASQYFIDYPLKSSQFGELGKRLQILGRWIESIEALSYNSTSTQSIELLADIEKTALSLFPFLKNPLKPENTHVFTDLRKSYEHGSKGVVIPTGKGSFRFACQLVSNLRDVLRSKLPIRIAYAGDGDLPIEFREFITKLAADVETLDVLKTVNDDSLELANDGWAIKPFVLLTSTFEQSMLLDADAVLLQAPEVIFDNHSGYLETGTLLFHDRLLWQGAFKERHQWWEKELEHHTPSPALAKSLVYNEGYAEECDSGMVVMDKSRLQTFLGLLHVCWQNTLSVRKAFTYTMGYGDKESWWFGLELSGANYTFEEHYGAVLGEIRGEGKKTKVCGFTIAHTDDKDNLLWYNGSLLKNKAVNDTLFDVPTHFMIDATWEKGATKPDMSCMRDGKAQTVSREETEIIQASVNNAKKIDEKIAEAKLA